MALSRRSKACKFINFFYFFFPTPMALSRRSKACKFIILFLFLKGRITVIDFCMSCMTFEQAHEDSRQSALVAHLHTMHSI